MYPCLGEQEIRTKTKTTEVASKQTNEQELAPGLNAMPSDSLELPPRSVGDGGGDGDGDASC